MRVPEVDAESGTEPLVDGDDDAVLKSAHVPKDAHARKGIPRHHYRERCEGMCIIRDTNPKARVP